MSGYQILSDQRYNTHFPSAPADTDCDVTHLDREISPIDIITQEQVSGLCGVSSNFEQFHKIVLPLVRCTRFTHCVEVPEY